MPKIMSREEIFLAQMESAFATVPNTSGTATVAGGDAFRAIRLAMNPDTAVARRRDKTGSRTATRGTATRRTAAWELEASLVTSGVAGTVPDHDWVFRCAFGQAASVKTGTAAVSGATNATPIVITTGAAHGLASYDVVNLTGVGGNTNANGVYAVRVLSATTFELIGSAGNAAYTSGGTVNKAAIQYAIADTVPTASVWSFRNPATAQQRVMHGAAVNQLGISFGEDIATFRASGPARWVLGSNLFGAADVFMRGGLTSFPVKPTGLTTSGDGIPGFIGRAVIGGSNIVRIRTGEVQFNQNVELPSDTFGTRYVDEPEADERAVNVRYSMYEDDSAGQAALEQASVDKTPVDVILHMGETAGSHVVAVLRGAQLASPERNDGQRAFVLDFGDSQSFGSDIESLNEFSLWML